MGTRWQSRLAKATWPIRFPRSIVGRALFGPYDESSVAYSTKSGTHSSGPARLAEKMSQSGGPWSDQRPGLLQGTVDDDAD